MKAIAIKEEISGFSGVRAYIAKEKYTLSVIALFLAAFLIRIYNLAYNSPFSDEAIYVVVGKLGLFQHDWFSYSAKSWMAGLPYMYPSFTAIAYNSFGILGSRFFNVIVGMFILKEVYVLTDRFVPRVHSDIKELASLIAVFVVAFSTIGIFVSRLATYDALCFYFLLYGLNRLMFADAKHDGADYFGAFVTLILAFYTKIIAVVYFPFMVLFSYVNIATDSEKLKLWRRYFLYPFMAGGVVYAFINLGSLFSFSSTQIGREHAPWAKILGLIWYDTSYILIMALCSLVIIFFFFKSWRNIIYLVLFASIVPAFHLAIHRYATLEKHILLTIVFLAPIIGYAAAFMLVSKNRIIKATSIFVVIVTLMYFPFYEYKKVPGLQNQWPNSDKMVGVISNLAKPESRILTESGPVVILAVYEKTRPTNVTTMDWFEYGRFKGDGAYVQAVSDGYFDIIEITGKTEENVGRIAKIRTALSGSYRLVYSESPFQIYERAY